MCGINRRRAGHKHTERWNLRPVIDSTKVLGETAHNFNAPLPRVWVLSPRRLGPAYTKVYSYVSFRTKLLGKLSEVK